MSVQRPPALSWKEYEFQVVKQPISKEDGFLGVGEPA